MNVAQRAFLSGSFVVLAIGSALYCLDYRVVEVGSPEHNLQTMLANAPEPQREYLKSFTENNPEYRNLLPLLDLGELHPRGTASHGTDRRGEALSNVDELLAEAEQSAPTYGGIYARSNLTPLAAMMGGILVPTLLLIMAGYLALGSGGRMPWNKSLRSTQSSTAGKLAEIECVQKCQNCNADVIAGAKFCTQCGARNNMNESKRTRADKSGLRELSKSELDKWQQQMSLCDVAVVAMALIPPLMMIDGPSMMLVARYRYPRWVFIVHCLYAFARR